MSSTGPWHGLVLGGMSPPKDLDMVKPIERCCAAACSVLGPPALDGLDQLPPAINPARTGPGRRFVRLFPNFMVLVWQTGCT